MSRANTVASPATRFMALALCVVALGGLFAASPQTVVGAVVPAGFTDTLVASGFGDRLTLMTFGPDGRLYVSEKGGRIRIVDNGRLLTTPFLTVQTNTESERGLKGLAFDPLFETNRYVYVYYTDPVTIMNKVSRFTVRADNPNLVDPASEVVLVSGITAGIYHSAGSLHFGPDAKLYVSTGDGSVGRRAQDLGNLDGKILRINRDGSAPVSNPFVGQAGARAVIWAYGLRNPYTFAFDPATGRMLINDVGLTTYEEINEGRAGANYGWPTCEGPCSNSAFDNPIYSYDHSGPGKAIVGAAFYRASQFPSGYAGDFFFADYVGGYIARYDQGTGQVSTFATGVPSPADVKVGPDGSLYYLSVESKVVRKISYGTTTTPTPTPTPTPRPIGALPVAQITAPPSGTTFRAGDVINFSGGATDQEDGTLGAARLTWEVVFHHDTHTHPFIAPFSGQSSGAFTAPDTGESASNIWYRIHLTARDSDGNTHHVTRDVRPQTATVTLATQPSGLKIELDGSPVTAPYTFTGVVRFKREISAPLTQTLNGTTYNFVSWSDGGAARHVISTPSSATTLTAVYRASTTTEPTVVFTSGFDSPDANWLSPWRFNVRSPARAGIARDTKTSAAGDASARVRIRNASQDWHVQLLRPGLSLVAGTTYTLTFQARASDEHALRVAFQGSASPFTKYAQSTFAVTTSWRQYRLTFTAPATAAAQVNFNFATETGIVWIDSVRLTR